MGLLFILFKVVIMSEDQSAVVTLKVRVTPEFREKIIATAKENNRSMNQEIVARLEGSFESTLITEDQKIQYGKGFLSGTATALSILYGNTLNKLQHQYTDNPTPELHLEIEKYKFLIEKLELLADNENKDPILDEFKKAP